MLSHSIMQLAETQSRSLEIFAAQQKSQIDVYQELTRSNKEKEHDALFTSIPVFDSDRTQCEQWLDDMDQATRISGCDLRTELIKKLTGVVRNVIMMAHPDTSDDDLTNMLREDFSDAPMMNKAREELLHMCQKPEEQMCVYVYRYGRMHQRSSGIRAADETHQHVIQDFIKSLKPKIKNKFANKFAEHRFQPRTLEQAFSLALDLEKKIQIADSFRDDIMDSRTPATVNEVQSFPLDESRGINEISSYRNNNSNNHGKNNYNSKPWQQKNDGKPWQNREKNNGRTEIISHGRTKTRSHGRTTRAVRRNPGTPVLHCHKIKNSLFQQIVMRTCFRSSAPWSKHKSTKQNSQVAMGKRLTK